MAGPKVLIVEDEFLTALEVEQELTAAGFEVVATAATQDGAVAMAKLNPPDVAIVDINLKPGDGRRVAHELVSQHGTAVLLATGNVELCTSRAETGAVAAIPKPYSTDVIPAALEAKAKLGRGEDAGDLPDHMVKLP